MVYAINNRFIYRGFHQCLDGAKTIKKPDGKAVKGRWLTGELVTIPMSTPPGEPLKCQFYHKTCKCYYVVTFDLLHGFKLENPITGSQDRTWFFGEMVRKGSIWNPPRGIPLDTLPAFHKKRGTEVRVEEIFSERKELVEASSFAYLAFLFRRSL